MVNDLIDLKASIIDLLPDDALMEASVSTPTKAHLNIEYYDVINPNEINQYSFLEMVKIGYFLTIRSYICYFCRKRKLIMANMIYNCIFKYLVPIWKEL